MLLHPLTAWIDRIAYLHNHGVPDAVGLAHQTPESWPRDNQMGVVECRCTSMSRQTTSGSADSAAEDLELCQRRGRLRSRLR